MSENVPLKIKKGWLEEALEDSIPVWVVIILFGIDTFMFLLLLALK